MQEWQKLNDVLDNMLRETVARGDTLAPGWRDEVRAVVRDMLAAESERCLREPVAAQCRFPGVAWSQCDVGHARMVMANPHEWPKYQVRLLCEWVGPNARANARP